MCLRDGAEELEYDSTQDHLGLTKVLDRTEQGRKPLPQGSLSRIERPGAIAILSLHRHRTTTEPNLLIDTA